MDEALRQLPEHNYIYLADSINAPYGEKSSEWIAAYEKSNVLEGLACGLKGRAQIGAEALHHRLQQAVAGAHEKPSGARRWSAISSMAAAGTRKPCGPSVVWPKRRRVRMCC